MQVSFFLDGADLDRGRELDPDGDWRSFIHGEEAWLLQTYLRLSRAGMTVELTSAPADGGIVVFHAKQKRVLARQLARLPRTVLVAVRGDLRGSLAMADFEIVQNARRADGRRRLFLPHWPQPGLVARDERRGDRISRLGYKGNLENLDPAFRAPDWARWLAERGIEWICDAPAIAARRDDGKPLAWPDYLDLDVVLAVRPATGDRRRKPATKLYNSWLAGTPALLGAEPAYRELRSSELDYLEVRSIAAARAAVIRLQEEPGLFRAMAERGRDRSREFVPERTLGRWRTVLEQISAAGARIHDRPLRRLRRRLEARRLAGAPADG